MKRLVLILLLATCGIPAAAAPRDDHSDHSHGNGRESPRDAFERIASLEAEYTIRRDGKVEFEQRFRTGVAGVAIKRGPVLSYLTAHVGPANLILDSDLEILGIERNGAPEDFRIEHGDGFAMIFVGNEDRLLERGVHEYRIRGRMDAEWIRGEGELSTVFDIVGAIPKLPIDAIEVKIRLPEGVHFNRYTPALTGATGDSERWGPAYEAACDGEVLRLRTTAPLDVHRHFFANLTWPSATFAEKSPWPKVMRQHPRLPLAAFSGLLLSWALVILVARLFRKAHPGHYAVTST